MVQANSPSPNRRLIYLRDLLRELIARDMKLRYKRSILGIAWSLLNPLAQLLVFTFVFQLVLPLNIPNYSVFLFTGLLAWSWFQSSILLATGAIVNNRELIRQPGFPTAVLPIVTVATHLVHYLLALPVLFAFLLGSGTELGTAVFALLPLIILQFLFTLGIAYFVAAIHVIFRDTEHLLGIFLLLLFYLTPIFYDAGALPAPYRAIYNLNPLVHLIEAYRFILIQAQLPPLLPLLIIGLITAVLLITGYRLFMQISFRFVEEL